MKPSAVSWRSSDRALLAASGAGVAGVAFLLVTGAWTARPASPESQGVVAMLERRAGGVLRRPAGTLVWDEVRAGAALHADEALYVPPGGAATVGFRRGSALDIEERSLVVLERPADERAAEDRIALVRGGVAGTAAGRALAVRAGASRALLEPGAEARLARAEGRAPSLEVYAGRTSLDGQPAATPAGPRLLSPRRGERIAFSGTPPTIPLTWTGGAGLMLEVARDPSFADTVAAAPGRSGSHAFRPPGAGTYYWRLAAADGAARGEARRLTVTEDAPPLGFSPMPGEIVLAPPGHEVPFWWTAIEGATRYRVEVATDAAFRALAFAAEGQGTSLWADLRLPEGVYYWRVRAVWEGGEGAASVPAPFRLVLRPVPDAPLLFDPAIEVRR